MPLSPFLPSTDADTVVLDFGVFLAEQARTYRTSQSAIIAALRPIVATEGTASNPSKTQVPEPYSRLNSTTPSQPEVLTHATAAQTDGKAAVLPADPSVDLSGLAAHEQGPIPSPAAPSADDAADGQAETLLSEPSVAPKSKRVHGRQELVIQTHREHPDWPDSVIAKHLGCHDAYVRTTANRLGLILPSRRDYEETQKAKTTEALKASPAKPQEAVEPPPAPKAQPTAKQPPASKSRKRSGPSIKSQVFDAHYAHPEWTAQQIADHFGFRYGSVATALFDARKARNAELAANEPVPKPTPQTPVAPPPPRTGTLTDRVRALHQQHPTWTARLIANELGENVNSVSTLLAQVRGTPSAAPVQRQQFTGRMDMINHYSEVAKRLGKAS